MEIRTIKVTEKEWELIDSVRNYKRGFPNAGPDIRWYVEQAFFELLDEPLDDSLTRILRKETRL